MGLRTVVCGFALTLSISGPLEAQQLDPGITPPRVIFRVEPQYSDTARAAGIEGTVTLDVVVRKDGTGDVVGTKKSLGYGLDENAELAMHHWQFQPAVKDGSAVDVEVDIEVYFRLSSNPTNSAGMAVTPRLGEVNTPPRVLSRIPPRYSQYARDNGIAGTVVLEVTVRADGIPEVIRVVKSVGSGLDAAAIDAINQWRFRPATRDGRPVDVSLNLEVAFDPR
jgi:TonB family protein